MRPSGSAPLRAASAAAALLASFGAADSCSASVSPAVCPGLGQACTQATLCASGLYCNTNVPSGGISGSGYSGVCANAPNIATVRRALFTSYDCGLLVRDAATLC